MDKIQGNVNTIQQRLGVNLYDAHMTKWVFPSEFWHSSVISDYCGESILVIQDLGDLF